MTRRILLFTLCPFKVFPMENVINALIACLSVCFTGPYRNRVVFGKIRELKKIKKEKEISDCHLVWLSLWRPEEVDSNKMQSISR